MVFPPFVVLPSLWRLELPDAECLWLARWVGDMEASRRVCCDVRKKDVADCVLQLHYSTLGAERQCPFGNSFVTFDTCLSAQAGGSVAQGRRGIAEALRGTEDAEGSVVCVARCVRMEGEGHGGAVVAAV
jgi:hypothetical protein